MVMAKHNCSGSTRAGCWKGAETTTTRPLFKGGSLVFGTKPSSLYALDIGMLFKASVERVWSFGAGHVELGALANAQEQYGSRVSYGLAAFSLYTTSTQARRRVFVLSARAVAVHHLEPCAVLALPLAVHLGGLHAFD